MQSMPRDLLLNIFAVSENFFKTENCFIAEPSGS